jgi:hypothetical protein
VGAAVLGRPDLARRRRPLQQHRCAPIRVNNARAGREGAALSQPPRPATLFEPAHPPVRQRGELDI